MIPELSGVIRNMPKKFIVDGVSRERAREQVDRIRCHFPMKGQKDSTSEEDKKIIQKIITRDT